MNDPLTDLSKYGVAIWLDDLSRERLTTGNLAGRGQVAGVIANPGIFAEATTGSGAYSPQVRDLAGRDVGWEQLGGRRAACLRQPPRQDRS